MARPPRPPEEGHRKRLRERLLRAGHRGLSDRDALELLLSYAIPRRDTKPMAHALIERFGSLGEVLSQPPAMLRKVEGIGESASALISLVSALPRMSGRLQPGLPVLDSLEAVKQYLGSVYGYERREKLYALLLDSRNRLLAERLVDSGTVDRSAVHPRNLVEKVIESGATAVILVHNHPGGRLEASREDLALTRRLSELGSSLGFRVLDHLIVSPDGVLSMRSEGLI
ncbi:DNA repair protein RadC [Candidatus Fermentibacterales bacterium]|nr:DNA repair protein RadC [Candidatus Fermentibacterales bacterium]